MEEGYFVPSTPCPFCGHHHNAGVMCWRGAANGGRAVTEKQTDVAVCVTCGKLGGVCRWVDDPVSCMRLQLAERDAEIERLRGMTLDLASVPSPWRCRFVWIDGSGDAEVTLGSDNEMRVRGTGPTPAAALADAIRRIG